MWACRQQQELLHWPAPTACHLHCVILADSSAALLRLCTSTHLLLPCLLICAILQDQKIDSASGDANFEALAKYGTDLTANAARLDPVIGRDDEIRRVVRILSR
jgi:ATP-dependent Clp protease ATP-binding subunit ClpA